MLDIRFMITTQPIGLSEKLTTKLNKDKLRFENTTDGVGVSGHTYATTMLRQALDSNEDNTFEYDLVCCDTFEGRIETF